jgi:hypothetical protein
VAVYLWVLSANDVEHARIGAAEVVNSHPGCWWWASGIAKDVLAAGDSSALTTGPTSKLGAAISPDATPAHQPAPNLSSPRRRRSSTIPRSPPCSWAVLASCPTSPTTTRSRCG